MYSAPGRAPSLGALEDPFYYLANFQHVLDWVGGHYRDLLDSREVDFLDTFPALPRTSQALLVRMIMRKGELFRAGKLVYDEIGPAREAVQPLVEQGWVEPRPALSLEQVFSLFTKAELLRIFRGQLERTAAPKPELLAQLAPRFPHSQPLADWWPDAPDTVFALSVMDLSDRFRLMFFGNLHQDWTDFVLADLGLYRYETVPFTPGSRAFDERWEVDRYLQLHRWREAFDAYCARGSDGLDELRQLVADVPERSASNSWLDSRRDKLIHQLAYHCERRGHLEQALVLYRDCSYRGARVRRIRVLERSGRYREALELAQLAREQPESEEELQQLARIMPRLRRKLGLPPARPQQGPPVKQMELVLPRPAQAQSVERLVQQQLHRPEAPVWFVENQLVNALFGLLCWEAVFAPLPGAFFHRFHAAPVDLLRLDFVERRAGRFDELLALLESDRYKEVIRRNYVEKMGLQSPFVRWEGLAETLLEQALDCLPAHHLQAWFRRLLLDIRANRAGMPDLVQFFPGQRSYRMIEVKAPGDRLQDNQLRWLEFCARHGMPVEVCYVQWADDGAGSRGD